MAGFDDSASLSGGSKPRQSLDRDTLIGAAIQARHESMCGCDGSLHSGEGQLAELAEVGVMLDAVLPLVADAIEQGRISEGWDGPFGAFDSAYNDGVTGSARLVRGLAGGSGE